MCLSSWTRTCCRPAFWRALSHAEFSTGDRFAVVDKHEFRMLAALRSAEADATGRRVLPFFVDPIEKNLKIEKETLVRIYRELQIEAENSAKHSSSRRGPTIRSCSPSRKWSPGCWSAP